MDDVGADLLYLGGFQWTTPGSSPQAPDHFRGRSDLRLFRIVSDEPDRDCLRQGAGVAQCVRDRFFGGDGIPFPAGPGRVLDEPGRGGQPGVPPRQHFHL